MGEQQANEKKISRRKKKVPIEFYHEMFLYGKQKKNPNDFWRLNVEI